MGTFHDVTFFLEKSQHMHTLYEILGICRISRKGPTFVNNEQVFGSFASLDPGI